VKALIKVGYGCNENCTFCHTQDVRHIDAPASEVEAKIHRARALGHTMVVLSGGEATIRPELLRWAGLVAELGMDFGLVTNGLLLAYDDVVERLIERRLRYVYLSIHGGDARIHNRLVRSEAFEAAHRALRNLAGRGLDVMANCVVTQANLDHLRPLVDLIAALPDVPLKFSMVEPKGGAWHLFEQVVPRVEDAAAKVADAIAHGDRIAPGRRFLHGGFPLCLLPGLEDRYDDLKTHRYWTMIEVGEPDFFPIDDRNKIAPDDPCRDCRLRGPCPGLYRVYHERFGAGALRPVVGGPRSNAFDWVFEEVVDAHGDDCPLRTGGVTPWDRGRHLFVRHDGRIGRFRADTRDFADDEIERIKHDAGQVYLDASRKPAPDDFPRDLVKLRRSALCDGCPEREPCTGMFEPVFEDVFTADDARVREKLRALEGDVLDVGCGNAPYADDLGGPGYVGIDPDADAIASLRRRHPELDLRCATLDDLPADACFDHVLVLRSWNHLPDPDLAATRLAARVRPGGTLLVVDNVAFGLARTPAQTHRARTSRARFEHFRNDDAAAAHRRLAVTGLQLVDRMDIDPARSNQWLLHYRRPSEGLPMVEASSGR
jgi:MoaA/NifB/PqqE/SkfB family radical SAM enzyme/SAM-dependent methyltransferase